MTDTRPNSGLIRVSHSQLTGYRRCQFKWHLSYQKGLRGNLNLDKAASLGVLIHQYFEGGFRFWLETNEGYFVDFKDMPAELWLPDPRSPYEPALEYQASSIVADFFKRQAPRAYRHFKILGVEERFIVPFRTPGNIMAEFEMIVDLIVQSIRSNQIYVLDHKSGRKWTEEDVEWDPQVPAYIQVCREMGIPVDAGIINWISTHPYKNRMEKPVSNLFENLNVKAHPSVKDVFFTELGMLVDELYYRKEYPTKLTRDCKWCAFNEICKQKKNGNHRGAQLLIESYSKKDAYYRKESSEAESIVLRIDRRRSQSRKDSTGRNSDQASVPNDGSGRFRYTV